MNQEMKGELKKWDNWSLGRTVWVGLGSVFVATTLWLIAASYLEMTENLGIYGFFTIWFVVVIAVASKRKGDIKAKIVASLLIIGAGSLMVFALIVGLFPMT